MNRKRSLSDALHKAAGTEPQEPAQGVERNPSEPQGADTPPSRRGKKVIAGYFDPAVSLQLKRMALDGDSTVQALLAEALNLLFERHGKPPIA